MTRRARRIAWIIIGLLLLAGAATLCVLRWNAWFVNPPEPEVDSSDTLVFRFHTFGQDSVPGFELKQEGWVETDDNGSELCFMLLGDVHNALTHADWQKLGERFPDLDFYVQAGDFVERGYAYYFRQLYHQLSGTLFEQLPIMAVPGNHEYTKGVVRRLPPIWAENFPNPQNGPERYLGSSYYVDFPRLRLVMIDTNGLQKLSDFTILNAWTKQVIREANGRYTIAVMHHPVFSSCKGRQNVRVYSTFRIALMDADLVFSGHDHTYSRRGKYIGTNAAKKHYEIKDSGAFDKLVSEGQFYQVLTLRGDSLTMRAYELETGQQFDEVVLTQPCR